MKDKILVSACLMGFQVRYNGSNKAQLADALARYGRAIANAPLTRSQRDRLQAIRPVSAGEALDLAVQLERAAVAAQVHQ